MELGQLTQSLYPRAVNASMEGRLRQDSRHLAYSPNHPGIGRQQTPPAALHESIQWRGDHNGNQRQSSANPWQEGNSGEPGRMLVSMASAKEFGDKLAMVARQNRRNPQRRIQLSQRWAPRGREASRLYLDTSLAAQSRFLHEIV